MAVKRQTKQPDIQGANQKNENKMNHPFGAFGCGLSST
jgi:hypothetical protein